MLIKAGLAPPAAADRGRSGNPNKYRNGNLCIYTGYIPSADIKCFDFSTFKG